MNKNDDAFARSRKYATKLRANSLKFSSEHLQAAPHAYVAWLDLMGAQHSMSTSVQKSANFLARLHMAVERARLATDFKGRILPINDGVFITSNRKLEIVSMVGRAMILLAANFIATPRPHDRFLLRGGIAFGPVYFGDQLTDGVGPRKFRESANFLDTLMFGPALIQAYQAEHIAPPYGIAVHESARAFCPPDEGPFRMNHWMWWAPNELCDYPKDTPPLTELKDCLASDLDGHFIWLDNTRVYHGLDKEKVQYWREVSAQYFSLG